jgi:hypothetical protein
MADDTEADRIGEAVGVELTITESLCPKKPAGKVARQRLLSQP